MVDFSISLLYKQKGGPPLGTTSLGHTVGQKLKPFAYLTKINTKFQMENTKQILNSLPMEDRRSFLIHQNVPQFMCFHLRYIMVS